MATDYASSLPVRTESPGDIKSQIVGATTANVLVVEADGSINVNSTLSATDLDIRDLSHAQDSIKVGDGTEFLEVNADGSINSVVTATDLDIRDISHTQDSIQIGDGTDLLAVNADGSINSIVTATNLDIRDLTHATDSIKIGDGTEFLLVNADGSINSVVTATDLDIRDLSAAQDSVTAHIKDEAGNAFSESNPFPVTLVDSEGDEIHSYFETAVSVAAGASDTHTYTVSAGKTLKFEQAVCSGSAKAKFVVEISLDGTNFSTKATLFNSTSEPDADIQFKRAISIPAAGKVRITRHNRDQQPQALYSTIVGVEV